MEDFLRLAGTSFKLGIRKRDDMASDHNIKTCSELSAICLRTLRTCPGFDMVKEVVVRPKDIAVRDSGNVSAPNWIVAAIRPRVDNQSLRGAQETIRYLRAQYQMTDKN
jgi:hypothetical protein